MEWSLELPQIVFHTCALSRFVRAWRQFIQRPLAHEPVTDVNNGLLLCEHKGLVYPLDLDTESDYESV